MFELSWYFCLCVCVKRPTRVMFEPEQNPKILLKANLKSDSKLAKNIGNPKPGKA